jgi:hypothetical protein
VAIVVGSVPPVFAVRYEKPPARDAWWDSGYFVLFSDAPPPREEIGTDGSRLWCLHCLIDEHPEIGVALDSARQVGEVWLDQDGEWVDISPLTDKEYDALCEWRFGEVAGE